MLKNYIFSFVGCIFLDSISHAYVQNIYLRNKRFLGVSIEVKITLNVLGYEYEPGINEIQVMFCVIM